MSTNISLSQATPTSRPQTSQNPPWWNRRTKLERTLCFVTAVCLPLLAVMTATVAIYGHYYLKQSKSISSDATNLCLTPGCVKSASEILLNIDESVDPCTDFYQFACGGWLNRHDIAEDKSEYFLTSVLNDDLNVKLRDLLEKKLDDAEPTYIRMIKDLYNSCMDLNTIEEVGAEPLKKVLSTFGGWPAVEGKKWDERKFDWLESLKAFRKHGYNHNIFLVLAIGVDEKNNSRNIIKLEGPTLGIPDLSYWEELGLNDSTTAAYFKQMVEAAKHLGADEATVESELLEVLHFEMTLSNYSSLLVEDERNVSAFYNKYTVKELQNMVPQIPWLKYFNSMLNDEIYENDTLILDSPEFMKIFADVFTTTKKRVIANYMLWRIVDGSLAYLSKEWRDIEFEYVKVFAGASQQEPRWKLCVDSVNWNLNIALSSYYVRQYFDDGTNDLVKELVQYIHKEFLHILDETEWMDEITKAHAIAKAENMEILFGYPKELLNDTVLIEFFEGLAITNESYYKNIFKIKKWTTDYGFAELQKLNVRGEWRHYADVATVNAFVDFDNNILQFPAGILQNPFFNKDRPNYMNFGAIGAVMGHEITHGFDDQGRQFDKIGNNVNWWEPATDERFKQKAQCIIDQYSNYTTEIGMKVNGIKTQGENIADNGGLRQAYLAYLSWAKDNGQEQLLPGLNYNQKQLFWISNAYVYCGKSRPEALKLQITSSAHAVYKYRVIGPMSNLQEFSKDFNCPLNSKMNKKPKCQVW